MPKFELITPTKEYIKPVGIFLGPTGSGKTMGALHLLHLLVPAPQRIAFIDTERKRSMEYYGHVMNDGTALDRYDVLLTDNYSPQYLIDAITYIQDQPQYGGMIIDSISHFWIGTGGLNEIGQKGGYPAGWKKVQDYEDKIYSLIFNNKLVTWLNTRVKMDFEISRSDQGKVTVNRMGLKPIARNELEYEFSFVGRFTDNDGNLIFDKASNITELKEGQFRYQMDVIAAHIKSWLASGDPNTRPIKVLDGHIVPDDLYDMSDSIIKFVRNVRSAGGAPLENLSAEASSIVEEFVDENSVQVAALIGGDGWSKEMVNQLSTLLKGDHRKVVVERLKEIASRV